MSFVASQYTFLYWWSPSFPSAYSWLCSFSCCLSGLNPQSKQQFWYFPLIVPFIIETITVVKYNTKLQCTPKMHTDILTAGVDGAAKDESLATVWSFSQTLFRICCKSSPQFLSHLLPHVLLYFEDQRNISISISGDRMLLCFKLKRALSNLISKCCLNVLMCHVNFLIAAEPECSGPAAHLGAQQRDGDGGGEEMSQPQLPQSLPQLEH